MFAYPALGWHDPKQQLEALLADKAFFADACEKLLGRFDASRSGGLTEAEVQELVRVFAQSYRVSLPPADKVQELFSRADRRKDGELQRDELPRFFRAVCRSAMANLNGEQKVAAGRALLQSALAPKASGVEARGPDAARDAIRVARGYWVGYGGYGGYWAG
jgi:hypothetical protein